MSVMPQPTRLSYSVLTKLCHTEAVGTDADLETGVGTLHEASTPQGAEEEVQYEQNGREHDQGNCHQEQGYHAEQHREQPDDCQDEAEYDPEDRVLHLTVVPLDADVAVVPASSVRASHC